MEKVTPPDDGLFQPFALHHESSLPWTTHAPLYCQHIDSVFENDFPGKRDNTMHIQGSHVYNPHWWGGEKDACISVMKCF